MNKLIEYALPCGCYLRFVPSRIVSYPPTRVETFTCEAHADPEAALRWMHENKVEDGMSSFLPRGMASTHESKHW